MNLLSLVRSKTRKSQETRRPRRENELAQHHLNTATGPGVEMTSGSIAITIGIVAAPSPDPKEKIGADPGIDRTAKIVAIQENVTGNASEAVTVTGIGSGTETETEREIGIEIETVRGTLLEREIITGRSAEREVDLAYAPIGTAMKEVNPGLGLNERK